MLPSAPPIELAYLAAARSPALVAPAPLTPAQTDETQYGPSEEKFLFAFSGSYTYANNSLLDSESLQLYASLGYFTTREHEYGLQIVGSYDKNDLDQGGGTKSYRYGFSPYYDFNWYVSPRLSVFAGPHVEFLALESAGNSDSIFGWGFQVGARYWISPNFGLELQPRFTHRSLGGELGNETELRWLFGINLVL